VITLLFPGPVEEETAQNNPSSGDQHTESQALSSSVNADVQCMPSGEVMIPFLVSVLYATAQNKPSSGDQQTEFQELLIDTLLVQVIPSGEVMTPLYPTTQNNPSSEDQHIDIQELYAGDSLRVQFIPSEDV